MEIRLSTPPPPIWVCHHVNYIQFIQLMDSSLSWRNGGRLGGWTTPVAHREQHHMTSLSTNMIVQKAVQRKVGSRVTFCQCRCCRWLSWSALWDTKLPRVHLSLIWRYQINWVGKRKSGQAAYWGTAFVPLGGRKPGWDAAPEDLDLDLDSRSVQQTPHLSALNNKSWKG